MLKVLSNILCDLDPKVKVIGQKAGICDGVPSTSALVCIILSQRRMILGSILRLCLSIIYIRNTEVWFLSFQR